MNMCDALMELFKEEFEQREGVLLQQGIEQGIELIICNALRNGHTPEQVSTFIGISLEEVLAVQVSMNQGEWLLFQYYTGAKENGN